MVKFFKAILREENISIPKADSKEVQMNRVIDFNIEVPTGKPTVFLNFTKGGKSRNIPVQGGTSRSFSPDNDMFLYNDSIYLYNANNSSETECTIISNISTSDEVPL